MSTKDFTANVISASKVVPDGNFKDSAASGIWDINEALDLIKGGNWPNVANVNPAAFVDGLFSIDLYDGTGANQTITNNINLSGSGGLVWLKSRDGSTSAFHTIYDTERGTGPNGGRIFGGTASANAASTQADGLQSFNSDGFTLGANLFENGTNSAYGTKYCSWTFRKQPKFFDIVTYTGDNSTQTVNHNLGSVPGMIIVKRLDDAGNWGVKHRSIDATDGVFLNSTDQRYDNATYWGDTEPTSTQFTVGTTHSVDSATYVAYLFAHNDDDGGFGEPGDQDIIKCGTYDTDANGDATVNLGFEPQFVLVKCSTAASNWYLLDTMRGMSHDNPVENARLYADTNGAESSTGGTSGIVPTSTGFFHDGYIAASETFIYMAIRRGGMQTPTAASSVFSIVQNTNTLIDDTKVDFGITPDMHIASRTTSDMAHFITNRLTGGKYMFTSAASAEDSTALESFNEEQTTVEYTGTAANDSGTYVHHGWKRARGYFDLAAWTGTGSSLNVSHNLGVEPEMIWVKTRSNAVGWAVYNKTEGFSKGARLELDGAYGTETNRVTGASSTTFTVGTDAYVNVSARTYIAYLFATVANVSKVGSFTQSGATNVACGFTGSTPSLIILKRTDDTGDWLTFDSTRGIIAGNDPYFTLNGSANTTNADVVDPYSGGFATTSSLTNGDYIFYAIAAIS